MSKATAPHLFHRAARSAAFAAVCLLCAGPLGAADETAVMVKAINERLTTWHRQNPAPSQRKLRFAYFLPSDREPAPAYRERLTRAIDEMADFYARQIEGFGLKAQPPAVDRAEDGLLRFVVVKGKEPWTAYNSKEPAAGGKIYDECVPVLRTAGIDPQRETVALFTAVMEWDQAKMRFRQRSPYQGRGDARSGFCWQIDAPPLDPIHLAKKEPVIDDGEYGKVSIGKWNSLFVGGIIHELGHAFGLAHNKQRPAEFQALGTSLMGSGNRTFAEERRGEGRGTFLTFADAVQLVSHPFFSGREKGLRDNPVPPLEFTGLQVSGERDAIEVSGRVTGGLPCYAVIAYTDGEGNGDYDSIATACVPAPDGHFRVRCDTLPRGKRVALRLTAMQVNGMSRRQDGLDFTVAPDGRIDLSGIRSQLVLAPVLAALRQGQRQRAMDLARALPDSDPAKAIAAPMLVGPEQRPISSDAKEASLCELRPAAAKVGWRWPAFDYSPEDLTIVVAGQREPRAIYAHAESRYAWNLDGTWKTLEARCALRDEQRGSVEFVVKLDGREAWRSGVVKQGQAKPLQLDLAGAKSLELIVTNGGDDFHGDHGIWIAPRLRR